VVWWGAGLEKRTLIFCRWVKWPPPAFTFVGLVAGLRVRLVMMSVLLFRTKVLFQKIEEMIAGVLSVPLLLNRILVLLPDFSTRFPPPCTLVSTHNSPQHFRFSFFERVFLPNQGCAACTAAPGLGGGSSKQQPLLPLKQETFAFQLLASRRFFLESLSFRLQSFADEQACKFSGDQGCVRRKEHGQVYGPTLPQGINIVLGR
jgi:hypothetical protein